MLAAKNRKPQIGSRASHGFSLIELIVVTAILTVILSGIVAVFLGSMKAVRQGYRHMDAYEMTRGAFQVVERDLTGGFTSRDNGDYYQFYGTPYGMTFVGVASNFQGLGNNQSGNICRVSYVLRQINDPAHPEYDKIQTSNGEEQVYYLIRYIERGVDTLDAFPVDWSGSDYQVLDPIEFPDLAQQATNLQAAYSSAQANAANLPREEGDRYLSTVKRDLWLRMLRGNGPVYLDEKGTLDTTPSPDPVPDFFQVMPRLAQQFPGKYDPDKFGALNVRDYVVVTNIQFSKPDEPGQEINEDYPFNINAFSYGIPVAASSEISPTYPILTQPITDPGNLSKFGGSLVNFKPFWSSMFWSTVYNPNLPYYDITSPANSTMGGEGSPLMPRIPSAVHMRLRLKFPAPSVAAAEIQRVLDEVIDVPSAFTRTQLGLS